MTILLTEYDYAGDTAQGHVVRTVYPDSPAHAYKVKRGCAERNPFFKPLMLSR